jgi:hypothetical protein
VRKLLIAFSVLANFVTLFMPTSAFADKASDAKILAVKTLQAAVASGGGSENLKAGFKRALEVLEPAPIFSAPHGRDYGYCLKDPKTIAFVPRDGDIYVCKKALKLSTEALAQSLIHEAAHVAGYKSECDATKLEVYAMKLAGKEIAVENKYFKSCF